MAKKVINMNLDEFASLVSKRINELFDKSNFKTQEELVAFVNGKFSRALVSAVKSGIHNVSAYNLALIVESMGGSLDEICFGEKQKIELADFKVILDRVVQEKTAIDDKEIRDVVLALTKMKTTNMSAFKTAIKFIKSGDQIDENDINAMNVVMSAFLNKIK